MSANKAVRNPLDLSMGRLKFAILGAGVSGLSAAVCLQKAGGHDVTIIEREPAPGGLCRSIQREGFTFDMTNHVLWQMDLKTKEFLSGLLGADGLTWHDRRAFVYTHGGYTPYPFQAHLKHIDGQLTYECLREYLRRPITSGNFEEWSRANFGDGIHRHFMRPFNEKLFGIPMSEIGTDWCNDVPIPDMDTVLRGATMDHHTELKSNSKFAYPTSGGMQSIVDALVCHLGQSKLRLGRFVCQVDLRAKIVYHRDAAGKIEATPYDVLLSTIPLVTLLSVAGERGLASTMRSTIVVCVMLGFDRPLTTYRTGIDPIHWVYTPEAKYPFYRVTTNDSFCHSAVPSGCGNAMAEITLGPDVTASSETLVKQTLAGLEDMGLWRSSNNVRASNVEYLAPAYVIYDQARKNAQHRMEQMEEDSVFCFGRFGRWGYSSVCGDIADARKTVDRILGAEC